MPTAVTSTNVESNRLDIYRSDGLPRWPIREESAQSVAACEEVAMLKLSVPEPPTIKPHVAVSES